VRPHHGSTLNSDLLAKPFWLCPPFGELSQGLSQLDPWHVAFADPVDGSPVGPD
jgi:hypothetical protein